MRPQIVDYIDLGQIALRLADGAAEFGVCLVVHVRGNELQHAVTVDAIGIFHRFEGIGDRILLSRNQNLGSSDTAVSRFVGNGLFQRFVRLGYGNFIHTVGLQFLDQGQIGIGRMGRFILYSALSAASARIGRAFSLPIFDSEW